jgi:hypothetical protein
MDPAMSRFAPMAGKLLLGLVLTAVAASAQASRKDCDQLRSQIEAKLRTRGVQGYSLDIVEAGDTGSARVVGNCDHGAYRIVYARGGGKPTPEVPKKSAPAPKAKTKTAAPQKKKNRTAPAKQQLQKKPAPVPTIGNY